MPTEQAEATQEICCTEIQLQVELPLSTFCPQSHFTILYNTTAPNRVPKSPICPWTWTSPTMQQHPLQAHMDRKGDRYTLQRCLYNNLPGTWSEAGEGKATELHGGRPHLQQVTRTLAANPMSCRELSAPASHFDVYFGEDAFAVGRSPQGREVGAHGVHQAHVQRARRHAERALQHVVRVGVLRRSATGQHHSCRQGQASGAYTSPREPVFQLYTTPSHHSVATSEGVAHVVRFRSTPELAGEHSHMAPPPTPERCSALLT